MIAAGGLRRVGLPDHAIDDELDVLLSRDGMVLDPERFEDGPQGPAHDGLAELEIAQRAALRNQHQQRDLAGQDQRRKHVRQRRETAGLHEHDSAQAGHVGAGDDADRFLFARRADDGEIVVRVQAPDQRREHLVRHMATSRTSFALSTRTMVSSQRSLAVPVPAQRSSADITCRRCGSAAQPWRIVRGQHDAVSSVPRRPARSADAADQAVGLHLVRELAHEGHPSVASLRNRDGQLLQAPAPVEHLGARHLVGHFEQDRLVRGERVDLALESISPAAFRVGAGT